MTQPHFDGFDPKQHLRYLQRLARALIFNEGLKQNKIEASDIVQDAMVQILEALPQFKGTTKEHFALWLRKILKNKFYDKLRFEHRDKRNAAVEQAIRVIDESSGYFIKELVAKDPSPTVNLRNWDRARHLADALGKLSEDHRKAFELHYLSDLSVQEIADTMGRTRPAVVLLLRQAKRLLSQSVPGNL